MDSNMMMIQALDTLLWSTLDYDSESAEYLDENFSWHDVDGRDQGAMESALRDFVEDNADDVAAYLERYDELSLAHDYILSRNGLGGGFWDRGLGDTGRRLDDALSGAYPIDAYVVRENDIDVYIELSL